QSGNALPGPRATGAEGLDQGRLADDGEQPRSEVLHDYARRNPGARESDRALAPPRRPGRQASPPRVLAMFIRHVAQAFLRRAVLRLRHAVNPSAAEPDLAREMASHLSLLEDDFVRRGMTREDARFAARRAFGGVAFASDLHRDARSYAWLDDLRRDLLYAAR